MKPPIKPTRPEPRLMSNSSPKPINARPRDCQIDEKDTWPNWVGYILIGLAGFMAALMFIGGNV